MRYILISAIILVGAALAVVFIVIPAKNEISIHKDTAQFLEVRPPNTLTSDVPNIDADVRTSDVLKLIEIAPEVEIANLTLRTGETLIAELSEEPVKVLFNDKEVSAFPYQENFRAAIPLPLGTRTGTYTLRAEFEDNAPVEKIVYILAKEQQIIILPPPPKLGMTDKQIVQNLSVSNTDLRKLVAEIEEVTRFAEPFGLPVDEPAVISSPFGEIRKTGEEEIVHLGVDFDVPKGTAVGAINAGTVESSYLDSIYGNSVVIDHGRGIYSLYLHLDSRSVKTGEVAEKGQIIGFSGDSGFSSAPHLHLSVKINGVSVDPIQFISVFR